MFLCGACASACVCAPVETQAALRSAHAGCSRHAFHCAGGIVLLEFRAPKVSHPAAARAMSDDAAWGIEPTTTFYIAAADPVELGGKFLAYFESDGNYVVTGEKGARASVKVWMQGDARRGGFVARIKLCSVHRVLSVYAVEWQRRSGCSLSSHEAFDRFKARFAMPVL